MSQSEPQLKKGNRAEKASPTLAGRSRIGPRISGPQPGLLGLIGDNSARHAIVVASQG